MTLKNAVEWLGLLVLAGLLILAGMGWIIGHNVRQSGEPGGLPEQVLSIGMGVVVVVLFLVFRPQIAAVLDTISAAGPIAV